jgi:hypothetical protein
MLHVHGKLSLSIPRQLVTAHLGKLSDHRQIVGRTKIVEPTTNPPATVRAVAFPQLFGGVQDLR